MFRRQDSLSFWSAGWSALANADKKEFADFWKPDVGNNRDAMFKHKSLDNFGGLSRGVPKKWWESQSKKRLDVCQFLSDRLSDLPKQLIEDGNPEAP